MPFSLRDNDADVRKYVGDRDIQTMLDVGPGSGTYGTMLNDLVIHIEALEIWEPYVVLFGLSEIYHVVHIGDVRSLPFANRRFDLVVLGDVLEHMTAEEGAAVWKWVGQIARHAIISVPIVEWPQGEHEGNPHEVHVQDHLTPDQFRDAFGPFDQECIYEQTATFFKEFR